MVRHPEGKKIPPFLASETVKHLFGRTHGEGRGFFRVKRAEPQIALTGFSQLDKLTDELNNIDSSFDFFFYRLV
jgi:hypothetical protein